MEANYPQITLGEPICEKIKNIFHSHTHWIDCYRNIAIKFTELKRIMRNFYPEKKELELLKELSKYSLEDITEAFSIKDDPTCTETISTT